MTTVTLWILLAISAGGYNAGNVTVIARFTTQANCERTLAKMPVGPVKSFCVEAQGTVQ